MLLFPVTLFAAIQSGTPEPEPEPGLSFTPFAFYDQSSIQQTGGFATQWTDIGPNGIHFSQATSASQPAVTSSGLVFDGTDDVMVTNPLNLSTITALCAFASLKMNGFGTSGDGDGVLVLGPSGGSDTDASAALLFYPYDTDVMGTYRGAALGLPAVGSTSLLLGVTYNTSSDDVTLYNHTTNNSVSSFSLSNDAFSSSARFVLGSRWIGGVPAPGYFAPFEINRLLLTDFIPNSTQLTEIWTVLGATYVPLSAPVLMLLSEDPDDHMEIKFTLTGANDTDQLQIEFDNDPSFSTIDEDDTISLSAGEIAAAEGTLSITPSVSGLIYARAYLKRGSTLSAASNTVSATIGPPLPAILGMAYAFYDETSVVQSGGVVSQWTDRGPNGLHLVQATAGSRPAWNASTSWIEFDGVNDFLVADAHNYSAANALCVFARLKSGTTYGGIICLGGPDDYTGGGFSTSSGASYISAYRDGGLPCTVTDNADTRIGVVNNRSGAETVYNQDLPYTDAAETSNAAFGSAGRLVVGARWNSIHGNGGLPSNLKIKRLVVFDFVLTAPQRDEVWAWLGA